MTIRDLSTHPAHYLSVSDLAKYWGVGRQQIYKRIESGSLAAIRLGSRLYRVPTQAALEFERRASVPGIAEGTGEDGVRPGAKPASPHDRLPRKIDLEPVPKLH